MTEAIIYAVLFILFLAFVVNAGPGPTAIVLLLVALFFAAIKFAKWIWQR